MRLKAPSVELHAFRQRKTRREGDPAGFSSRRNKDEESCAAPLKQREEELHLTNAVLGWDAVRLVSRFAEKVPLAHREAFPALRAAELRSVQTFDPVRLLTMIRIR